MGYSKMDHSCKRLALLAGTWRRGEYSKILFHLTGKLTFIPKFLSP